MKTMSEFITKLEGFPDLEVSIIRATKINKVLKAILKLENIPKEEEFKFKPRSQSLLDKWNKLLAGDGGSGSANGVNGASKKSATGTSESKADKSDKSDKSETKSEPASANGLKENGDSKKEATPAKAEEPATKSEEPSVEAENDSEAKEVS